MLAKGHPNILYSHSYTTGAVRIIPFNEFDPSQAMREDKQETLCFDLDS